MTESEWVRSPCPTCQSPRRRLNGRWLARRRTDAGLTFREMAARCGCSPGLLHDIEHNRRSCNARIERQYRRLA